MEGTQHLYLNCLSQSAKFFSNSFHHWQHKLWFNPLTINLYSGQKTRVRSNTSSSGAERISMDRIFAIIERLKANQTRASTAKNYHMIWKSFNKFLLRLTTHSEKYSWEERAAFFGAYLVEQGIQSSTLKSYLSAIKCVLKTDGYEWSDDKVVFSTLIKGCKITNDEIMICQPIKKHLLETILFEIQRMYGKQPYLETLYTSILLLGYYGLMRIGGMVKTDLPSDHAVHARNVHIALNKKKILLVLYSSKTHGKESRPQKIKITAEEVQTVRVHTTFFCPFATIRAFLNL